jgi:polyphosphate kinase 2 (PPK2 family)
MEGSIQEILGRLLAGQQEMKARLERAEAFYAEMKADIYAKTEGRQEKADADAKTRHEEAEARQQRAEGRQEKMKAEIKAAYAEMDARAEARHERFLARLDGLTSCGKGTTTCQTTSCSEEMEATNLEATTEATEAAVKRPELFEKEEANFDNIGSSEDRSGYQRLAVRRR